MVMKRDRTPTTKKLVESLVELIPIINNKLLRERFRKEGDGQDKV